MARKSKRNQPEQPLSVETTYKVGIYIRLSTEDKKDSIESQTYQVKSYVDSQPDLAIYKIYTDNGETGTNFERSGFENMMIDVRSRKVDCVVVKDLSRFGRDYIETGIYLEKIFPFLGVRFISVNDRFDSFKCTSSEEMMLAFKNLINDIYAKDISKKIITAIEIKQRNGDFIGDYAPYGYSKSPENKNKLIINPETAAVVRDIFNWKLEGMNYIDIARKLNASGIASSFTYMYQHKIVKHERYKNILWRDNTIKGILTNPNYIGHIVNGKQKRAYYKGERTPTKMKPEDWIVVPNMHEPIIDKGVFDKVQALCEAIKLSRKAPAKAASDYLFKGLIKCPFCGKNVVRYKGRDKFGVVYYYRCRIYNAMSENPCKRIGLREDVITNVVYKIIASQIKIAVDMEAVLEKVVKSAKYHKSKEDFDNILSELRKKAARILNLKTTLYERYLDKMLTENEYIHTKNKYEESLELIHEQIDDIAKQATTEQEVISPQNKWVAAMCKFKKEKKLSKEMLQTLIERIDFDDDKNLSITWKHQDEYIAVVTLLTERGWAA